MKKNYFVALLLLISGVINAQITPTSYRGAFAPAPTPMWTDTWTNFDPQNTVYPAATVTVSSAITTNTTWTSGNTYLLSGLIYVKNNATLTIQAGTKILGDNSGSALIITKGAKLNAIGTASNPIVFTSDKAVGARNKGDWGGIILLGKGSFNINGGVNNIEGITASADTQYGGGASPDDNDNSGTLKYVRIEFGGYVFAPNNEINGLTMGAVGRGTTIDYVQVSNVNDDAFEWFGGSVDCTHLVSFRTLDDDFDTDNGYNGRVQFALAVRDPQVADAPAVSTSEGFESDNNASGTTVSPFTSAIFSNLTMVGPTFRNTGTLAPGYKRVARIRRASQLKIYNSVFMDFLEGIHIDGVASENAAAAGTLRFNNNILAGIVTTSKVLQITAPGTITAGNNASFNMTSWYAANGNTTLSSNSGLLTMPYGSNLSSYTGLDYRPAANSPLLTGADFSDSYFTGILNQVPTSKIRSNQCGITLGAISTTLFADVVTGAQAYRFQVTNGSTVRVYEPVNSGSTANNSFNLTQLTGGVSYGATYAIKVAVKIQGVWGDYGVSCNVTTPAAAFLTKVKTTQCGITLLALNTPIFANVVYGVEAYRFEVTNGASVQLFEPANIGYTFNLTQLPGGALFSTVYTVRVATKVNGVWGAYGDACTITTPSSLTKVIAAQCGVTLPALNTQITANEVATAQGYRFEVTDAGGVRTFDNTAKYFNLTLLPGGANYGTVYSIRVAAKLNGVYQPYGDACNVTTVATVPLTKVRNSQCGVTLAGLNTSIYADQVAAIQGYKFEVTNGSTVRFYETTVNYFNLTLLSGGAAYGTDYSIRVATKYNNAYGDYGQACTVSTPAGAPLTKLRTNQCGVTIAALTTTLYAGSVSLVEGYRFEVTNGALVRTIDKAANVYYFKLTELSGEAITYSTAYSVRVATKVNGVWGPYGAACVVTTPNNVLRPVSEEVAPSNESNEVIVIKAYPNPFSDSFVLNFSSESQENIEVAIYDMTGNLVERRNLKASEISNFNFGNNYRTGIYNGILSQGSIIKSFRVIKK